MFLQSEEDESDKIKEESDGPEQDDGSSEIAVGPGCITHATDMRGEPSQIEREEVVPQLEDDIIPQPIPFQMGITPQEEDSPPGDELTDWYDDTRTSDARGSTDVSPTPKAKAKAIVRRERSPRNLRNRQVARSIRTEQRVNWNLQAQKRESLKRP